MKKVTNKTILLVEEKPSEVAAIKNWISDVNEGHVLYTVKNCMEALDLVNGTAPHKKRILPDIILLNIYCQEMDGLEFLGIIKSYFSLRSIKVFIMIPSFDGDEKAFSRQFDVDGIIAKPFQLNFSPEKAVLLEKLENSLNDPNGLRLQGLFIFPTFMQEAFSVLKNLTRKLLVHTTNCIKPVILFKPVGVTALVIATTIIATATGSIFKKRDRVPEKQAVVKTAPVKLIVVGSQKVDSSKQLHKAHKKRVLCKKNAEPAGLESKPDTMPALPVKETRNLKIAVIEEDESLYESVK